jgi:serine protease Do
MVAETPISKEVDLVVWREGKKLQLKATVGELTDEEEAQLAKTTDKPPAKQDSGQTKVASLGLTVGPIGQAARDRFDLGPDAKGVVVTEVAPSGAAAQKGIHAGDVIVEVSQEEVNSPADFAGKIDAARKAGRKSVLLLVQGDSGLHFVPLRVDVASADPEKREKAR